MSGVILMSNEASSGDGVETQRWNPLQCNICSEQYQDPCILQCYHSFCSACILARIEGSKVTCPVCSCVSTLKEGSVLPSPDPLLKFLVESSSTDKVPCANCDKSESEMFFCNTCCQPLCLSCREETHRARMFARHEINLLTKRAKDIQKECKLHKEPYILFSTEKKIMLCINCFRDMKVESRSHCVDLETAYKQGCQKINNTMQSIRDLQHSVRETILLLKALLEEIQQNSEREKQDILSLYNSIEEKISETKVTLLKEIENQYEEKERLFKDQLVHLSTFLPTLHVHLVTCAAFCSSANKYEFLDFTYVLMERLKSIIQVQHPLHPSQGSDIFTDHKTQFAKCLQPLLFPHGGASPMSVPVSIATSVASQRLVTLPSLPSTAVNLSSVIYSSTPGLQGVKRYNQNTAKYKLDTQGFFADHCKDFDSVHRELMHSVDGLKLGVQELQRDLTLRRCLAKEAAINTLDDKISGVEELLSKHLVVVEQKQPDLEKHWEESLEKLAGEQEVYKAQIQDVLRLQQETQSVKTILHRLSSFVSSIANVTERLAPKLSMKKQEDSHNAILQEINTMQHDSQQRVDAIRTAQEERDFKTANRTNPLDDELIKTKGLLKAPVRKDCKDPTKRESREISDAIAELEEERQAKEDKIRKECSADSKKDDAPKKQESDVCVRVKETHHGAKNEEMAKDETVIDENVQVKSQQKNVMSNIVPNTFYDKESVNASESDVTLDISDGNDSYKDITKESMTVNASKIDANNDVKDVRKERNENDETVNPIKVDSGLTDLQRDLKGSNVNTNEESENEKKINIVAENMLSTATSRKPEEELGRKMQNQLESHLSGLDLIQTSSFADSGVEVESQSSNCDDFGVDESPHNSDECNAEFTLNYEEISAASNLSIDLNKDGNINTGDNTIFNLEYGMKIVHSRKRLDVSGLDSGSEVKTEECERKERDSQEILGANKMKNDRPVDQKDTLKGVDSSVSCENGKGSTGDNSITTDTVSIEHGIKKVNSRNRLDVSGSESGCDSKSEESERKEPDIQELFGARQLKHIERPVDQNQILKAIDSSASVDNEVISISDNIENGLKKVHSIKRLDLSGSDSGSDSKSEESERKEPDIQELFGARQLKHVEKSVDQNQILKAIDSSASGDNGVVTPLSPLAELSIAGNTPGNIENGLKKVHSRKRLDLSGSDSGSDSKSEESDRKEPDIKELFGARQLKHVEKPVDQNQTVKAIESSASGDNGVLSTSGNIENGLKKVHSRKRLDMSGSDSGSDSKSEECEKKEPDIKELFGARQLKHVEKPVDVNQPLNGVDSSASGDDEEVYIAKSLPELAQVFEPGDLKPKRHSRKNDGSKSPNPK